MTPATRANAEAIAAFVNEKQFRNARVGSIAGIEGCPIRPPREEAERDAWNRSSKAAVGQEPHCQRVTAALNAAAELGLVFRVRGGSGPWRYSALEAQS